MSRSKKTWDVLVDSYGNYDFAGLLQGVNGVTQDNLDEQLSNFVSKSGDVMDGGLFIQNSLGYAYAIEPFQSNRPAGSAEVTRNGRIIAEQYWDPAKQWLAFNVRNTEGAPTPVDSLEIGRDLMNINVDTNLAGDLYIKGDSLAETLEALSSEINYQVGLLEAKIFTKYNKTGGDISGTMSVTVGGDTKLTVNRLGVTLSEAPTQNFHAATKKYVDDAIADGVGQIDLTGVLQFLGVRDLTTVDPDGDEIVGNTYVNEVEGAATAAWGLTGTIPRGAIVALGEIGWIVIGEVGIPDLSGFITKVESDARDDALDLRLLALEADPISKTESDAADALLSGRLDTLEADFITKTESEADDLVLSNRIDAIEGDYVQVDNYNQDLVDLNAAIDLKADTTYVDAGLALKADKTYVDDGLELKADKTYVDDGLALKADKTYVDAELALKADKTYVDSGLALKADTTYVDDGLALKADKTYVDSELASKSDITYVDTGLALKLDKAGGTMTGALTLSGAPTADLHASTKKYVDDAIDNLGDVLNFKGTVDFTTDTAPTSPAVGDVYANTGTGAADASWGLTGDVSPGELYGKGVTQWGLIGSSQVDLTGYATETYVNSGLALKLDKAGDTMTGSLTLSGAPTADLHAATKKYVDDEISSGGASDLYLPKLGATVNATQDVNFSYNRNVYFYTSRNLDLESDLLFTLWGEDGVRIVCGEDSDIVLKPSPGGGRIKLEGPTTVSSTLNVSNNKIQNVEAPTNETDAVNKKYVDDLHAIQANKTYVDDNFLPLNFNTLPALT